jgi:hypothetical protein
VSEGSLVLAIARPLLPAYPELEEDERAEAERELDRGLAQQLSAMPRYLRVPFAVALVGFNWLPLLRYGRTYGSLPPATQARVVAAWSRSPLGAMRTFIKLVRTCALFAWLDHPLVAARLEREVGASPSAAPVAPERRSARAD